MAPSRQFINLLAVMWESLLVGVYAVLIGSIIWLLSTGRRSIATRYGLLFGASIAMFVIPIVHLGLVMHIVSTDSTIPVAIFQTQIVLATFQFVIGELVLIWRVWAIWGRNYWVAGGPLAIMIAAAGLSLNLATITETPTFFAVAPVTMMVANTSICTLLIAGRICYMQYQLRKYTASVGTTPTSSSCKRAVLLIIESGALYAATQIISLILHHVGSPGLDVMQALEVPLIGILPTLIIVLVHFNMATTDNTEKTTNQTVNFGDHTHLTNFSSSRTSPAEDRIVFKVSSIGSTFEELVLDSHLATRPIGVLHTQTV